ncbi:MAG: hypothetical protein AAFZ07_16485 [Actinomycetota bacterium]
MLAVAADISLDGTQIIVSLFGLIGVLFSAYWARQAKQHASSTDRATNQQPLGSPTLVERVVRVETKLEDLDNTIGTRFAAADELEEARFEAVDEKIDGLTKRIDELLSAGGHS